MCHKRRGIRLRGYTGCRFSRIAVYCFSFQLTKSIRRQISIHHTMKTFSLLLSLVPMTTAQWHSTSSPEFPSSSWWDSPSEYNKWPTSNSNGLTGYPQCEFGRKLCSNLETPMCTMKFGDECGANGCVDFFGNPTECQEPLNKCGDSYCGTFSFCGDVSKTCLKKDCVNLQKERCPGSLADGTCDSSGLRCPSRSFTCSVAQTSGVSSVLTRCYASSTSTSSTSSTSTAMFDDDTRASSGVMTSIGMGGILLLLSLVI